MEDMILELILGLLGIVGTAVGGYLIKFMVSKESESKENTRFNFLTNYITIAKDLVESTVVYYNQTIVPNLKMASADGKLTAEEAVEVFEGAKSHIMKLLSESAEEAIVELYGDLGEWIDMMIETYVNLHKTPVITEGAQVFFPTPTDPEYLPQVTPPVNPSMPV